MADNTEKKFKHDLVYRIHRIMWLADKYGWKLLSGDNILEFESIHHWNISNSKVIMRIDTINIHVETILDHPHKGNTQLTRKGEFSMKLIEKLFRNPRAHMPDKIKGEYVDNITY